LTITLRRLTEQGPHAPLWWRYDPWIWQSLDNRDDDRACGVRVNAPPGRGSRT
jgi:hypothetical protein